MSWEEIPLEEIMVKKRGSVNPVKFKDENFELYSIPAFDAGAPEETIGSSIGSSKKVIENGDVLLSRIVPHIKRTWIINSSSKLRKIGSGEWMIFNHPDFEPKFLKYFLQSERFHSQMMRTLSGVGGSLMRARPSEVAKIKIPLPPLPIQKKIAEALEKADKLRQLRQEQLNKLDELLQSTFLDMFGDPVTNPKGWEVKTLGEDLEVLTDYHANGSYAILNENVTLKKSTDYAYMVRTTDLENENYIDDVVYIDEHAYEYLSKTKVFGGEIIINKIGSAGKVYHMPILNKPVSLGMNSFLLRFNENVDHTFMYYQLKSSYCEYEIQKRVKGAVTKTIRKDAIREIPVIIPPKKEQEIFLEFCHSQTRLLEHLGSQNLSELFNSLMQKAFKGELEFK